jgi:hypothetical protein
MHELGRILVILAAIIGLLGLLLWTGWFPRWLGRLPGDIQIEGRHFALYFPIVTCLIVSLLVSLLLAFFRR